MKTKPEAKPTKVGPGTADPAGKPDSQACEVPEPATVSDRTSWGEVRDSGQALIAAKAIGPDLTTPVRERFAGCRKALKRAAAAEIKGRNELYTGLVSIYDAGKEAYARPEILIGAALAAKIPCNKKTLETGFLLAVKLADPKLDRKKASFYARGLNYGAACGMNAAELRAALDAHGVKALADNEAKRQRLRKTGAADEPAEDPLEQFLRERQPATPLAQVVFPEELEEQGLALLVVRHRKGKLEALDFDDDPKRLLAVIRAAIKRGQISPRGGTQRPQAAE